MDFSNSILYQFTLHEYQEILKHKWIESEKSGYDIGIDLAVLTWKKYYRQKWVQEEIDRLRPFFFGTSGIS
jgi:hypothetical protein